MVARLTLNQLVKVQILGGQLVMVVTSWDEAAGSRELSDYRDTR